MRATLTSKCQFTLPAQIRDRLGLGPGDQLDLRLNDQGWIEMRPVRDATGSIWDLRGCLGSPPERALTPEEMDRAITEGAAGAPLHPDEPEA